jgi:hypothetical protein
VTADADVPANLETRVVDKVSGNLGDTIKVMLDAFVRLVLIAFAIVFICEAGLGVLVTVQARSRNHTVTRIDANTRATQQAARESKAAAEHAQAAAEKTSRDLAAALRQSREGNGLDTAAVIDALQRIARIEQHLCGGPCPAGAP